MTMYSTVYCQFLVYNHLKIQWFAVFFFEQIKDFFFFPDMLIFCCR